MKADKFTLLRHFDGFPKSTDFRLESEELPGLGSGEVLCRAEYLSVDPYMRAYAARLSPPVTMIGAQVAQVIDSKDGRFPVGSHVVGDLGWRTLTIARARDGPDAPGVEPLADLGALPRSYALGACGMPGVSAYFGLLELCRPLPGETVAVTGAAGAVGSLVGQIAKISGCRVVGFAGTDAKCDWLRSLGFDAVVNYRTCADVDAALKAAAPGGVDCFFDNVGGMLGHRIRARMNTFGRVAQCGSISGYNDKAGGGELVPAPEAAIVAKQLRVEGFIMLRWWDRRDEAVRQMATWVQEGRVRVQETVTEGFHRMPQAFTGMLKGHNTGKAVVKV